MMLAAVQWDIPQRRIFFTRPLFCCLCLESIFDKLVMMPDTYKLQSLSCWYHLNNAQMHLWCKQELWFLCLQKQRVFYYLKAAECLSSSDCRQAWNGENVPGARAHYRKRVCWSAVQVNGAVKQVNLIKSSFKTSDITYSLIIISSSALIKQSSPSRCFRVLIEKQESKIRYPPLFHTEWL